MLSATKNFLNKNYKYINLWRKIANKLNYIKLKPFMINRTTKNVKNKLQENLKRNDTNELKTQKQTH